MKEELTDKDWVECIEMELVDTFDRNERAKKIFEITKDYASNSFNARRHKEINKAMHKWKRHSRKVLRFLRYLSRSRNKFIQEQAVKHMDNHYDIYHDEVEARTRRQILIQDNGIR